MFSLTNPGCLVLAKLNKVQLHLRRCDILCERSLGSCVTSLEGRRRTPQTTISTFLTSLDSYTPPRTGTSSLTRGDQTFEIDDR